MKKILVAMAATLLVGTVAAHADTIDVTGSYKLSYQATDGTGPGLNPNSGSLDETLTVGTATKATDFFTASPAGSSGLCTTNRGKTTCTDNDTVSGTITAKFTINTPDGTQTISDTGSYLADYSPKSDSIDWTTETLVLDYSSLLDLDIILGNASDWDISPTISFELVDAPPTTPTDAPEPGSLALLGTALVGFLGFTRYRRARA
ncbi:MAG TPA: PEP-CTERM sorting domain-containing protein [Acetobacteraceae bacterium]|nr:PEP-CTERM sorting domain-containing protein [Acetobacteraceae bacterium]